MTSPRTRIVVYRQFYRRPCRTAIPSLTRHLSWTKAVADIQSPPLSGDSVTGDSPLQRPSSPRPMAPAHTTHPRPQQQQQHQQQQQQQHQRDQSANPDIAEHGLFLEPMMGTPLAMYVHKDVPDHGRIVDLITVSSCACHRHGLQRVCATLCPIRVFPFIFKKKKGFNSHRCLLESLFHLSFTCLHLTVVQYFSSRL